MKKPTPIPNDLLPGDIIVLSNGERRGFKHYDGEGDIYISGAYPCALCPNGRAYAGDHLPHAVKIIRNASKPAKPKKDADAEWLRRLVTHGQTMGSGAFKRRIRKIAKRLERAAK